MTCYKLVTVEFKWFGLQTRIENFIQKSERRLFTKFHRYVLCISVCSKIWPFYHCNVACNLTSEKTKPTDQPTN